MNIESFEAVDDILNKQLIQETISSLIEKYEYIINQVSTGDSCSRACPRDKTAESCSAYYKMEIKNGISNCHKCWHDYVDKNTLTTTISKHVARLEREHTFMLALLVDIERVIDHGDQQQITVAIKRLRDIIGTETIMKEGIKPGLVRT